MTNVDELKWSFSICKRSSSIFRALGKHCGCLSRCRCPGKSPPWVLPPCQPRYETFSTGSASHLRGLSPLDLFEDVECSQVRIVIACFKFAPSMTNSRARFASAGVWTVPFKFSDFSFIRSPSMSMDPEETPTMRPAGIFANPSDLKLMTLMTND